MDFFQIGSDIKVASDSKGGKFTPQYGIKEYKFIGFQVQWTKAEDKVLLKYIFETENKGSQEKEVPTLTKTYNTNKIISYVADGIFVDYKDSKAADVIKEVNTKLITVFTELGIDTDIFNKETAKLAGKFTDNNKHFEAYIKVAETLILSKIDSVNLVWKICAKADSLKDNGFPDYKFNLPRYGTFVARKDKYEASLADAKMPLLIFDDKNEYDLNIKNLPKNQPKPDADPDFTITKKDDLPW